MAPRRSVFEQAPPAVRKAVWKAQSSAVFAAQWEDLARASVVRSEVLASLAGEGDFWLPAGRWWHGNEPELDVVSFNGARTRVLVGEAKWSDAPFELAEVLRLAAAMKSRPLPPGFPAESVYVLFLASVSSDVPRDIEGVRIITAKEVCSLSNAGPSAE